MSNGKIFYNNIIANSTLSVSSEAEGFEKEYLVNNNPGTVWRSTDIEYNYIYMVFPEITAIKGIVLENHNIQPGEPIYFYAKNDPSDPILEDTFIDPNDGYVEVNWNYKRYVLQLKKNSGSYIQVGEIYLPGTSYEFERNFNWNYSYTREINRNSKQTTSGQVYRKTRFIRKGFDLEFDGMTDTQKETFEDISENDYICFLPTGSGGDLYYGIVDFSTYTHVYNNYWSASVTFMENPK